MDAPVNEIAKNVVDSIEDIIREEYSFLFKNNELKLTYLEKMYLYRLCCTNLALDAYLVISFQNE